MKHKPPFMQNQIIIHPQENDIWKADITLITSQDSTMPIHIQAPTQTMLLECIRTVFYRWMKSVK